MGVYRLMATPALFGLFHSVACCIYLRSFWWTVHLFHLHEWANSDWLRLWLGSGDINEADAPLIASPVVLWPMITNEGENVLKIPFFLRITDEREHQFSRWIRRGTLPGRGRQGDEIVLQLIGLRVGVEYSAEGEIPLATVWGYEFSPCL